MESTHFTICTAVWLILASSQGLAQKKEKPNYRTPSRAWSKIEHQGRSYIVEKELIDNERELAKKALKRLGRNIDLALTLFPRHSHEHLEKQQFWLLYGPKSQLGGHGNGLAYFRPGSPKFDEKRHEDWNSAVVVYHAQNYASISDLWALKSVMHELGHAYQLEQWPEKEPHILAAYENAMKEKLYLNVKTEKGKTIEKAYATVNQLEYFAELTCMHFGECNYGPRKRVDLRSYDPVGYEMIRRMWKIGKAYGRPERRAWTLGKAGRQLEGIYQSSTRTHVRVLDSGNRSRRLALSTLSQIDRDYVNAWEDR